MGFRDESMEAINLPGAGIDTEALQNVWEASPDDFSMSFTYKDTTVYIDNTHIVLTDSRLESGVQTVEEKKAESD